MSHHCIDNYDHDTHKYVNTNAIVHTWNIKFMIKHWFKHEHYEYAALHDVFPCNA